MAASDALRATLRAGLVIPAHPLALTSERRLDERRQAALTRYYCDAGAGGIAVGVHTTQFAIRDMGLLEPVLRLAIAELRARQGERDRPLVAVAGVCGATRQAVSEAGHACRLGYDLGLLSLGALRDATDAELIAHCRRVAEQIPLFGFYLQPAVGGRRLAYEFWREFLEIEAVVAIKVAPFSRYETLAVARALADSARAEQVALYTGNDDSIVADLLTEFEVGSPPRRVRFAGGLLGQWAVWTRRAVELLDTVRASRERGTPSALELLRLGAQITDANAALFDAANGFAGCIAGIHEVLRRQGLLAGRFCLDPKEDLSPGQSEQIDRVLAAYPHLTDDDFVAANLDRWLR
jgi:dihydrodipicolinate synthase/N-acetylneuraminate lyase